MIFDEPSRQPLPQARLEDLAHAGGKGLLSMIPLVGGFGAELVGLLASPVAQRRDDWLADLERRLRSLEDSVPGFAFEDLSKNEQFVSATLTAIQASIKTHQIEKLKALRNAVLNVALGKEPGANRQQQYLALVDRFSEAHLVVLKFLSDPAGHLQRRGEPVPFIVRGDHKMLVNNLVSKGIPELRTSSSKNESTTSFQFVELILGDLVLNHLVTFDRLNDTWAVPAFSPRQGGAPVQRMVTHLGDSFLSFIEDPAFSDQNGV